MKLIRKSEQHVNTWSGGTTRQLYIYPEGSTYADRNFDLRISTATVETETSVFTSLPGYARVLMVLEGELKLEHTGQHTAQLQKFDADRFMGDWQTTSYGMATDFNVISTAGYKTAVQSQKLMPGNIPHKKHTPGKVALYIYSGSVSLDHSETLYQGDFILFEDHEFSKTSLQAIIPAELVMVFIEQA